MRIGKHDFLTPLTGERLVAPQGSPAIDPRKLSIYNFLVNAVRLVVRLKMPEVMKLATVRSVPSLVVYETIPNITLNTTEG
jgi:hypothetical protein